MSVPAIERHAAHAQELLTAQLPISQASPGQRVLYDTRKQAKMLVMQRSTNSALRNHARTVALQDDQERCVTRTFSD